jgi:uncharacterized membrane protein HdeD (DUF308 family)
LILLPRRVFALMCWLLPCVCVPCGLWNMFRAFQLPRKERWRRFGKFVAGAILLASGILLWVFFQWRTLVMWYVMVLYLAVSAWQNLRPVWARAVEKQIFWRVLGSITVLGFAVVMLRMPGSMLNTALMILGCFMIAWGMFQLLLPTPRE